MISDSDGQVGFRVQKHDRFFECSLNDLKSTRHHRCGSAAGASSKERFEPLARKFAGWNRTVFNLVCPFIQTERGFRVADVNRQEHESNLLCCESWLRGA